MPSSGFSLLLCFSLLLLLSARPPSPPRWPSFPRPSLPSPSSPFPPSSNPTGLPVCVRSAVSDTSIYPLDFLLRFGKLSFNYTVVDSVESSCPDSTANLYISTAQDYASRTAQDRVHLALQTDGLVLIGDSSCSCPVSVCSKSLAHQFFSASHAEAEFYSRHPKTMRPVFLGLGPRSGFRMPGRISLGSSRPRLVSVDRYDMLNSKFVLCEPATESH